MADTTVLVPLTNSLYVPGKLSDAEHVIVDVGTGYYVKKVRALYPFSHRLSVSRVMSFLSLWCILAETRAFCTRRVHKH